MKPAPLGETGRQPLPRCRSRRHNERTDDGRASIRTLHADVLVVGAGPTGLMLACCLAKLGRSVVVIDGKSGPTVESRALVLQARTLEIYDQLEIADRALSQSAAARAVVPGFEKRSFGRVDLGRLAAGVTPFRQLTVFEQSRNERLLIDRLGELGASVHWGHALDSLIIADDGGSVTARTSGRDPLTVHARFCVGADGSGSRVRELSGIPFDGVTNPHTFYVIDAVGTEGLATDAVNVRFGEAEFLLAFPMGHGGHMRLLGVVPDGDGAVAEQAVHRMLRETFGVSYASSRWFATYRVHHRVARTFRAGPVFLAGDAAHVHSPVGAQGMNTGLQDAHNLACKIADVLAGRADDRYLDSYQAERRPVAMRLVGTTDRVFGVITSDRPVARFLRRRIIPFAAPIAASLVPRWAGSSRLFEYLSQTRIRYRMSSDARSRRDEVTGRRLPWNGDNHRSLRAMTWQVHAYGSADAGMRRRMRARLGVAVRWFPRIRNRRLVSGYSHLIRPDGFVRAAAPSAAAAEIFAACIPPFAGGAPADRW